MNLAVLDTDILNEVFKRRNRTVAGHAAAYLQAHSQFTFSAMTRFEMVRGIRHKKSSRLMREFNRLEGQSLSYFQFSTKYWIEQQTSGFRRAIKANLIATPT